MNAASTDEALLARFAAGHAGALDDLARRYEPLLLGLATGILGGSHDLAADAVQETWVRVIRFAAKFNGRSNFKTWLYRIAVNQCRSLRSARSEPPSTTRVEADPRVEHEGGRDAANEDDFALVRRGVERLDDDKRLVLLLCYHREMTHEQAAEVLEIPVGTLKSRLHAALNELRLALQGLRP